MAFLLVEEPEPYDGEFIHENDAIFGELDQMMRKNPQKVKQWFVMAVREMSDSLYYCALSAESSHRSREADGEKGDPLNIEGKDNIEAASYIMVEPSQWTRA